MGREADPGRRPEVGGADIQLLRGSPIEPGNREMLNRLRRVSARTRGSGVSNVPLAAGERRLNALEEKEAILDERPTLIEAWIHGPVLIFFRREEIGRRGAGRRSLPEATRPRIQQVARELSIDFPVERIASALGTDVDHSTQSTAKLGFIATGLDLDFADELTWNRIRGAKLALVQICGVYSIKDENVFERAGSVHLN